MADILLVVDSAVVVPVNIFPLVDDTDAKTREAVAYNAAGMDLRWNFVTAAGATSSTAVTPTTAGTYDWTDMGDGMMSIEIPASGGASINNDTEGFGWFSGVATGVMPWRGPIIQFSPANVANSLVAGSDVLDVSLTQVNGAAQTATLDTLKTDTAAILVDTGTTLDGRIPAALVSGRMDASVGAIAANAITAASMHTDASAEIADAVWDENLTTHLSASSAGAVMQPMHSSACQAGGDTTTVVLASTASADTDAYKNCLVFGWVTADRSNFFSDYITAYNGTSKAATVSGIPYSTGATYTYVVVPGGTIPGATALDATQTAAAVWNAAIATYASEGSFGNAIGGEISHEGTLQSGVSATSVIFDATGPANHATNDIYKYDAFYVVAGTGIGQSSQITGYVGSSKTATLAPALTVQLDNTSRYIVKKLGIDASTPAGVAAAVWNLDRAGHAQAGSFGEYVFADTIAVSHDATAADNMEAFYDGTGYAGTNNVIPSVTTVTGNVNGNVGGSVATLTGAVTLADGAHGGSAAVITAKRLVVANTTNGQTAVDISSSGTGNAHAVAINATGAGKGMVIGAVSNGVSINSSAADGMTIGGGTDSDGLQIDGNGTGVDVRADVTGNITGNVSGSIGSVTGAVASVTEKTGFSLSAGGIDAILDEAITEPAGVFTWAGATLRNIVGYIGAKASNKQTQTATGYVLRNRADSGNIATAVVADDATTTSKASDV
jgi:hypothetical protein